MLKIRINIGIKKHHNENYYMMPLLSALKQFQGDDYTIEETDDIPFLHIELNDKVIGLISYGDGYHFSKWDKQRLSSSNDIEFIFKYHYNTLEHDYSKFSDYDIYPIGLWRFYNDSFNYEVLLNKPRSIDVQARMRCHNSGGSNFKWSVARRELVKQCNSLNTEGYNTFTNMIKRDLYMKSLKDTKLAFIWSASARLGWKIPEYTEAGVVMISERLGEENPIINNTTFIDGYNYIECNNPSEFSNIAKELLKDEEELKRLKTNVLKTWDEKLKPHSAAQYLIKIFKTYT